MPLEPAEVEAELEGERVASVERRGKYIVVRFESGLALVVHLRMTGGFPEAPATHERATIDLDDGAGVSIATCAASGRGTSSHRRISTNIWGHI